MRVEAPAKLNLFLELLGKRPDGYHALETLMLTIDLHDDLDCEDSRDGSIALTCDHADLATGPENLVVRAAEALRKAVGFRGGARLHLTKRIPMAAGLAGGSSDAAATLMALNKLWSLGLSTQELTTIAAGLGSDVPFFLAGPAAWCTGRGEQIEPETIGRVFEFVLVCPSVGLSTARVYAAAHVPAAPRNGDTIRSALRAGDVNELGRLLFNRLQEPACRLEPNVTKWFDHLRNLAPAGCLMSGSGSSLFALCRDEAEAERIERETLGAAADLAERDRPSVARVRGCI